MIVIIVGMHRSGTSALAGLLHQNGIIMGTPKTFSPGPAWENEKGFFENYEFRSINDELLHDANYSVISFEPAVPEKIELTPISEIILSRIIMRYQKAHTHWGFKDPRICLTLNLWQEVFEKLKLNVKYILTLRKHESIADSMIARGNVGGKPKFIELSKAYYDRAHTHSKNGFPFIIDFDRLIDETDIVCQELTDYLGKPILNNGFIEKRLRNR